MQPKQKTAPREPFSPEEQRRRWRLIAEAILNDPGTGQAGLRAGQSEVTPLMAWLRQGAGIRGTPYRTWVKVTEINGYEAVELWHELTRQ